MIIKNLEELSKSIIKYINSYFKELDLCLNIKNKEDLYNLNYILRLSSMILDDAIEDEDIELAYESFFQIERRIKEESLFKKFQITFDENIKYVLENPYEKSSNSFLEIKNFELK